jgi:hypothetical protein
MHHTVLLTCAGQSSRFAGYRPKWSLTHPSGHMMAAEALGGLSSAGGLRVFAAMRAEHLATYGEEAVRREFALVGYDVTVLNVGDTDSPVQTVLAAAPYLPPDQAFTVKDCDNRFVLDLGEENAVACVNLHHHTAPLVAANKSYVQARDGLVSSIVEKQVTGPLFCCGAYTFTSPAEFCAHAKAGEFISEVVGAMLAAGRTVHAREATAYVDWGTAEDWQRYVSEFRVLFVDVDGVLVHSSHRTFKPAWGETQQIDANVETLRALHATGKVQIVLTTSRGEDARAMTERQLTGVPYDKLVMGLRGGARVVVNDYAVARGEYTCFAVNLERDRPMLGQLLRATGR